MKDVIENGNTLDMKSCGATSISEIVKNSSATLIKEGIIMVLINSYKIYKVAAIDPA